MNIVDVIINQNQKFFIEAWGEIGLCDMKT